MPPYYDSMIAKLITWGKDRDEALARALRALDFFVIEGIRTSIPLHRRILRDESFRRGEFSTRFMEEFLKRAAEERLAAEADTAERMAIQSL